MDGPAVLERPTFQALVHYVHGVVYSKNDRDEEPSRTVRERYSTHERPHQYSRLKVSPAAPSIPPPSNSQKIATPTKAWRDTSTLLL